MTALMVTEMSCLRTECREYCQFETFNASCSGEDQVVLMDEARYGRLRLGRCVTHDYGFLGCSSSVLDLLDRACSGRRWCQFDIPSLRDLVHPCPKDLTCYLEATYRCVTGAMNLIYNSGQMLVYAFDMYYRLIVVIWLLGRRQKPSLLADRPS